MTYYGAQSIHADEGMTIPNCDVQSFIINNTTEQGNGRNNLISVFLLSLQANIQGLFCISPLPDAAGTLGCSSAHVTHVHKLGSGCITGSLSLQFVQPRMAHWRSYRHRAR